MKNDSKLIANNGQYYYRVKLCKSFIDLPLFEVTPKTKIALFNILGETRLVEKIAKELAKKISKKGQVIVTPEVKSVCLAYELSKQIKIPYVVIRKTCKPYMLNSLKQQVISITTGKPQNLWLDGKDRNLLKGKKVILVDDVISTGNTLNALRKLMKKAEAEVVEESAVFTEGDKEKWKHIISLGHLPIFKS